MSDRTDLPLLEDPAELARYQGWSRPVYADLLAVEAGRMSDAEFDAKYLARSAVLVLDITGFTVTTMHGGAVSSFLRILDVHKICFPVLEARGASLIRAFADDVTALFGDCSAALDAALEIHERVDAFARDRHERPPECCIGIGCGGIYEIGPNRAMGDEMNRASKLGEDIARGGETLVTEGAHAVLKARTDAHFEAQTADDFLFPYYRVSPTGARAESRQ